MEQRDDLADAGTFRLIDAVLGMDGWRLDPGPAAGGGVTLALCRGSRGGLRIPDFARGRTPGLAALAAYERYRSLLPVSEAA